MESEKILSISVAAYNLGDIIRKTLDSFVNSSVRDDIEVIVTDDGSKDNTAQIVEEYVEKYPKTIKLIKKVNEGPGSTVNSGIKNATGKYFRMVDGDDWVETENLEAFIEFLKNNDSDLIVSDYAVYDNSNDKVLCVKKASLPALSSMVFSECAIGVPKEMHALTFKTSLLKENNIVLDNCFYTDVEYVLLPIQYVKTVGYFAKTIYVYRIAFEGQSVSVESMKRNISQHDLVLNRMIREIQANYNTYDKEVRSFICERVASMADNQLATLLCFELNKENKKKVKDFVAWVKQNAPEIYPYFKKGKKVKLLRYSGYLFYRLAARIVRKKNGN